MVLKRICSYSFIFLGNYSAQNTLELKIRFQGATQATKQKSNSQSTRAIRARPFFLPITSAKCCCFLLLCCLCRTLLLTVHQTITVYCLSAEYNSEKMYSVYFLGVIVIQIHAHQTGNSISEVDATSVDFIVVKLYINLLF